jgi:hypothetical protein
VTSTKLRVTGIYVGSRGWLRHLGIGSQPPPTVIPWDAVVRIEGRRIIVREEHRQ